MKRSADGGLTWSDRLPVPENWATSLETPTIHRVVGPDGKKRLIVWSGLYPARLAVSEDDGATWTPLAPAGDWGGIVVMSALVELKPFGARPLHGHVPRRRPVLRQGAAPGDPVVFTLYTTFSEDGGLTWSFPEAVYRGVRGPPLRAGDHPLARRQDAGRAPAREQPDPQLVRHVLEGRGQDLERAARAPGRPDRRPPHREICPRRPAPRLLPRHDPREPDEGRLGGLGRDVRRHRQGPGRAVPRPAHGQHRRAPIAPIPASRSCRTARSS